MVVLVVARVTMATGVTIAVDDRGRPSERGCPVQTREIRRQSVQSSSASSPLRTGRHAELTPVLLGNLVAQPTCQTRLRSREW